jgi:hypothetical protein
MATSSYERAIKRGEDNLIILKSYSTYSWTIRNNVGGSFGMGSFRSQRAAIASALRKQPDGRIWTIFGIWDGEDYDVKFTGYSDVVDGEIVSKIQKLGSDKKAMEFPTEEALKKYLKEHPKAKPADHTVKKDDGGGKGKSEEADKRPVKVDKRLGELLGQWHGSSNDPIYAVSSSAAGGHEVPAETIQKAIDKVTNYIKFQDAYHVDPKDVKGLQKAKKIMEGMLAVKKTSSADKVANGMVVKELDSLFKAWVRRGEKQYEILIDNEFDSAVIRKRWEGMELELDGSLNLIQKRLNEIRNIVKKRSIISGKVIDSDITPILNSFSGNIEEMVGYLGLIVGLMSGWGEDN